jgi:hypothetical protein
MKALHRDPNKAVTKKTKVRSQTIAIAYDREADVLSLTFGRPTKAEAEEIGNGIYARYAGQTGRLVEICVLGFSQRFSKQAKEINVPEYAK